MTERWGIFELALNGPQTGNPFVDVTFGALFKHQNRVIHADGFYDGNGVYKVRFMPDKEGKWAYSTFSNCNELDGMIGEFECIMPSAQNHGPVRVKDEYRFAYEDGTPYLPFGTTCYAWIHQNDELEEKTLATLADAPFNKMRMCVFPKHYDYNANEPVYYPFEGSLEEGWDFTRFNVEFFRHMEKRISDLLTLGIEADLILFHPYDRWGYSTMDAQSDERYLRYIMARLSAYRNIWWSMANEYDLMQTKNLMDWDRFFKLIQQCDPYQHLRSVHNCHTFYDHGKPWVTHCSIQHSDLTRVTEWHELYKKPVVVDECCYEGNIAHNWGNITAQEMVHRIWEGTIRGGYVGHGETYVDPNDILWWSKGGVLHGQSPERISFLRQLLEQSPQDLVPIDIGYSYDVLYALSKNDEYFLAYCGSGQSAYKDIALPDQSSYTIEIIDAWDMTVTPLDGVFRGKCRVKLPAKPYIGLRIRKVE